MSLLILVVEDEYEKMVDIVASIESSGVDRELVKQVTNAADARREMQSKQYDLLILDMNIPPILGSPVQDDGGITLLKMLDLDKQVNFPFQVLGITAKEEIFEKSSIKMGAMAWTVCKYFPGGQEWKEQLEGKIKYLLKMKESMKSSIYPQFDIAIITALRDIEFDAVLQLPLNWKEQYFEGDPVCYHVGILNSIFGTKKVIAAATLRMGMPSAAALSMKMTQMFRPKLIAMLGICAGRQSETSIGDVIIADPVWDWGSGKIKEDINGDEVFSISPHQIGLDPSYRARIKNLRENKNILTEIRSDWNSSFPEGMLRLHVGPMASGASVVANSNKMASLEIQNRALIGLEMEAYAVMAASEYATAPAPKPIVIKSVCDFGDATKNSRWQPYAAYTATKLFYILFRDHLQV